MAGLRFTDLQSRPTEFLDFTSVTLDEFQLLDPPFEAAFQAYMSAWRLDGKPPDCSPVYRVPELSPGDSRGSVVVYSGICEDLFAVSCPGTFVPHGAEQSQSVDPRPLARAAGRTAHPRRCPRPFPHRPGAAARRGGGRRGHGSHAADRSACPRTGVPPFAHEAFPVKTRNLVRRGHTRALDETSTLINLCF
jgi:hypothetical protein